MSMLRYSAIANAANFMPPYSVWYPATSSLSASGRSNGGRLVSAVPAIRKIRNPTGCSTMYHAVSAWAWTMSVSDRLCESISTPTTDSPIATSYETSCAAVRAAPSSEYLLPLA